MPVAVPVCGAYTCVMGRNAESGRLDVVATKDWLELVGLAAKAAEQSISGYVRLAVTQRMERDGLKPPAKVRPRGRPKK